MAKKNPPKSTKSKTASVSPTTAAPSAAPGPRIGFWAALSKSIYAPEFYKTIPQRSFGKALKYLMGLTALAMLLYGATFLFMFKDIQKELPQDIVGSIQSLYPAELEITLQDGKAYTNVTEPYFIDFPSAWEDTFEKEYAHIMVIDTQTPFTVDQLQTYESLIWLTEDSLVVVTSTEMEVRPLSELQNGTLTKEKFDEAVEAFAAGFKGMLVPLALIILLGIWVGWVIVRLIYGLALALLIMLLSGILRYDLDYAQSYKVGLHAITLSVFIQWLLFVLGQWVNVPEFPFHFTLVALLVVGFNFWPYRKPATTLQ
jgi:hypothetical protein